MPEDIKTFSHEIITKGIVLTISMSQCKQIVQHAYRIENVYVVEYTVHPKPPRNEMTDGIFYEPAIYITPYQTTKDVVELKSIHVIYPHEEIDITKWFEFIPYDQCH